MCLKSRVLFKTQLLSQEHYHFIGLGGIGMSGIALALIEKGFSVSGSDPQRNDRINELESKGAITFNLQNGHNIDLIIKKFSKKKIIIVISSAINEKNKEFSYCLKRKLSIKHRSEILSLIMDSYKSIAVAGSHGKTSTSCLLANLLNSGWNDTSFIIGGILPRYKSNTNIKNSKYLVAEIDESDGSIANYKPDLGIINNIDFDHCDYYPNLDKLICSFNQFGLNSEKLLVNYDCRITRENINSDYKWSIKNTKNIDFSMIPKEINYAYTIADYYEKGNLIETIKFPIPGLHNLSNITAAISVCRIFNLDIKNIIQNIQYLQLPKKRFEYRGETSGRIIIDDYGHHPSEIKATIELARLFIKKQTYNKRRVIVIFQPHRYTRVNQLLYEFVKELSKADFIIITDIYSAGEINITNINSQIIADRIYKLNKNVMYLSNNYEISKEFLKLTNQGDLILNMGAGDCHNLWSLLTSKHYE